VAFASGKAPNADSIRVSVLSFADNTVTPWFTMFGGMSEVNWLNDGTLLVVFQEAHETDSFAWMSVMARR